MFCKVAKSVYICISKQGEARRKNYNKNLQS